MVDKIRQIYLFSELLSYKVNAIARIMNNFKNAANQITNFGQRK